MTIWSPDQIADIWLRNGGSRGARAVAVAVALAESGGNDHAHSASDDYGLWQINSSNFGWLGINAQLAYDPDVNADQAIRMSGNGTNWAAWCTCWTNPRANCGHGFLPTPQPGSPAWNELQGLPSDLGGSIGSAIGSATATGMATVNGAWHSLGSFTDPWQKSRRAGFGNIARAARRMYA